jgi:hypothetical protein
MAVAAGLVMLFFPGPASAVENQEKYATCGWHAEELKLTGHKRRAFMKRCTADEDSPRGKPVGAAAKPAAKPKPQ